MNNRKTKIICTLGPAVDTTQRLRELILAGMNGARFNFSHGTHESHLEMLNKLRTVRDSLGRPVATILDTKGPEIRIKSFREGRVELTEGQSFTLTARPVEGDSSIVSVTYEKLYEEVKPGTTIQVSISAGPEKKEYTVTVTCGAGGSVSPSGNQKVAEGGSVSFTITPKDGYEVATLVIDGTTVLPLTSYSFMNVDSNHTLYVTFREK